MNNNNRHYHAGKSAEDYSAQVSQQASGRKGGGHRGDGQQNGGGDDRGHGNPPLPHSRSGMHGPSDDRSIFSNNARTGGAATAEGGTNDDDTSSQSSSSTDEMLRTDRSACRIQPTKGNPKQNLATVARQLRESTSRRGVAMISALRNVTNKRRSIQSSITFSPPSPALTPPGTAGTAGTFESTKNSNDKRERKDNTRGGEGGKKASSSLEIVDLVDETSPPVPRENKASAKTRGNDQRGGAVHRAGQLGGTDTYSLGSDGELHLTRRGISSAVSYGNKSTVPPFQTSSASSRSNTAGGRHTTTNAVDQSLTCAPKPSSHHRRSKSAGSHPDRRTSTGGSTSNHPRRNGNQTAAAKSSAGGAPTGGKASSTSTAGNRASSSNQLAAIDLTGSPISGGGRASSTRQRSYSDSVGTTPFGHLTTASSDEETDSKACSDCQQAGKLCNVEERIRGEEQNKGQYIVFKYHDLTPLKRAQKLKPSFAAEEHRVEAMKKDQYKLFISQRLGPNGSMKYDSKIFFKADPNGKEKLVRTIATQIKSSRKTTKDKKEFYETTNGTQKEWIAKRNERGEAAIQERQHDASRSVHFNREPYRYTSGDGSAKYAEVSFPAKIEFIIESMFDGNALNFGICLVKWMNDRSTTLLRNDAATQPFYWQDDATIASFRPADFSECYSDNGSNPAKKKGESTDTMRWAEFVNEIDEIAQSEKLGNGKLAKFWNNNLECFSHQLHFMSHVAEYLIAMPDCVAAFGRFIALWKGDTAGWGQDAIKALNLPLGSGVQLCHSCDNGLSVKGKVTRTCCNPNHTELRSQESNKRDMATFQLLRNAQSAEAFRSVSNTYRTSELNREQKISVGPRLGFPEDVPVANRNIQFPPM